MSEQYKWSMNPQKLQRAIALSKHKTEEEIKEEYLKIGGKVAVEDIKEIHMEEEKVVEAPVEEVVPEVTEEVSASEPVEVATEEVTATPEAEVINETVTTTDDVS